MTERVVASESTIKDLAGKENARVKILGTVVNKATDGMILDDGTGSIRVWVPPTAELKEKQLVLVIGWASRSKKDGELEIRADIVQDSSSLDLDAYRKVQKIWKQTI